MKAYFQRNNNLSKRNIKESHRRFSSLVTGAEQQKRIEVVNKVNYSNRTDLTSAIKASFHHEINLMFQNINTIINQADLDVKICMNYIRSVILFRDIEELNNQIIDQIVGEYAKNKIIGLEKSLEEAHQMIGCLNEEINGSRHFKEISPPESKNYCLTEPTQRIEQGLKNRQENRNKGSYSKQNQSLGQLLFQKAKIMNENKFVEYYSKIKSNSQCVEITKLKLMSPKKHEIFANRKLNQEFNQTLFKKQNSILIEEIARLRLNKCDQPCCRIQQSLEDSRFNKAKHIRKLATKSDNSLQNVYTSDKISEYFDRYYNKQEFNLENVYSITKSKAEEMEKLEKSYNKKITKIAGKTIKQRNKSIF